MPAIPDLPSRHESLITRVALDATDPGVIAATQRIESRRLKSEGDLRRSLTGYLRRSDQELGGLRPRDLLSAYKQYATETFRAAGEAYSGLFPSQEAFASALTVVTEWIVEEIVPGPQTVRERLVHHLTLPSKVLALGQKFGFAQNPDPTLLEEAEKNAPVLKDLASSVHPDLDTDASVLDDPIIPLDEPVAHFCNRTGILDRRAESSDMLRGGLWESLIDKVTADLMRTNEDRPMTYSYATELQLALRSTTNRDTAEEILRVAMEHETPNALGAWWQRSTPTAARSGASGKQGLQIAPQSVSSVPARSNQPPDDAKDLALLKATSRRPGRKADYDFNRQMKEIVEPYLPDWQKHLEQIADAFDEADLRVTIAYPGKRDLDSARWSEAATSDPDAVKRAIAHRIKMKGRELSQA